MAKSAPSKRPKRKRGERIPWDEIEFRYIHGDETMQGLADEYRCDLRKLTHKASVGKWTDKRAAFRRKTQDAAEKEIFRNRKGLLIEVALAEMKAARTMWKAANATISRCELLEAEDWTPSVERIQRMQEVAFDRFRKAAGCDTVEWDDDGEIFVRWLPGISAEDHIAKAAEKAGIDPDALMRALAKAKASEK